jgi:hypothetical protein
MRKFSFETLLACYLAFAALLAIVMPQQFAVENYIAINPAFIPFAAWLRLTPGAMPSLTAYFLTLAFLMPFLIFLLARYPQDQKQFSYQIPTLSRCIGATAISVIATTLVFFGMYGEFSSNGNGSSRGNIVYAAATSPLALAIAGPLLMGVSVLMLYSLLIKLPRMWLGFRTGTFG